MDTYVLGVFPEKGKSHVVGVEWKKDRLVGNEVRKVMELGVTGREYTSVLRSHNKDSY